MATIRGSRGEWLGETGFGYYGNTNGSCGGVYHSDGTFVDPAGHIVGTTDSYGHIYDALGNDTGNYVE